MLPKFDVIICTNIYNRVNTIRPFIESIFRNTKKETKFHIYLVANWDKDFPKTTAMDEINWELQHVDWLSLGLKYFDAKEHISILETPNIGLSGFNLGFEIGTMLGYVPVLCINDDTLVCEDWEKLLKCPTRGVLKGVEQDIKPEYVGVIAPCYINSGCMAHQKYKPNESHHTVVDFVVGHAQLVTSNALKKGFRYTPELSFGYGPYDVAQSMLMLNLELNLLVDHSLAFDFPLSIESHFHEGFHERFDAKLKPVWDKMQSKLEDFQKIHIAKHGHNKWYFE